MDEVQRGRRLRELREAAGLLQRHVGAEFDIDKSSVSEWERGKASPDRRKLARLDELYHADGEVLEMYGVTQRDAGVPDRVAALEQDQERLKDLVLVVMRDFVESHEVDQHLLATLDDLERERRVRRRAAQ